MKHRARARAVLRFAGRLVFSLVAMLVLALVGAQFAHLIGENVAMARDLRVVQDDTASLQRHREEQLRELRRLEDPDGAIPEIHDRLRLARPNEEIIFVSPLPSAQP